MSEQASHYIHNLRVLEGPPGTLKGSAMVCCKALRNLEIWQRVDFVTDCQSAERSVHIACPTPVCRKTIELDTTEIKRQIMAPVE